MRQRREDAKHSHRLSPIAYRLLIACLTLLLTGGTSLHFSSGASTVEAAARMWILRDPYNQPDTITIQRIRMIGLGAVVFASYDTTQGGRLQKITALLFVDYASLDLPLLSQHISLGGRGWRVNQGVRFARDARQPLPPLRAFVASDGSGRYTAIAGQVPDLTVNRVAITLSNGLRRSVSVINGSYVIAQQSKYTVLKVEALDAHGNVLYEGTLKGSGLRSI